MRFKLDENLGEWASGPLVRAGHDVTTVHSQRLDGTTDPDLIEHCAGESRCLITLDVEFGNPLLFPPTRYRGIVLLRVPQRSGRTGILSALKSLVQAIESESRRPVAPDANGPTDRALWIAQPDRVRIYQFPEDDLD